MSTSPRPIAIEELLADAGWVRRLAGRLVRDPSEADDLAQETFAAALRHPPRAGSEPRAWMARVLGNFARQRARSESARSGREQRVARAAAQDDDLLERAELAHRLAQHVFELDEPYRSTILRRFFDGWSAEEIGAQSGVPGSTVRTRLERGLAQLRARLERENGREWLSALLPLARIETAAAAKLSVAGIAGGIVMSTAGKVALAFGCAGVLGWMLWPRSEPPAAQLAAPPAAAAAEGPALAGKSAPPAGESEARREPVAEVSGKPAPALRTAAPAARAAPHASIAGRVSRGEKLLAEEQLVCWKGDFRTPLPPAGDTEQPLRRTRSDKQGEFLFQGVEAGDWCVGLERSGKLAFSAAVSVPRDGPGAWVEFALGSASLSGHVWDEHGHPRVGALVSICSDDASHTLPLRAARITEASGAYAFDSLPAGLWWIDLVDSLSESARGAGRSMRKLEVAEGASVVVDFGSARGSCAWSGSVRTRQGALVRGPGTLQLERKGGKQYQSDAQIVEFDREGRFLIALEPGAYEVGVTLPSHEQALPVEPLVVRGADELVRDVVIPGARITGQVTDAVSLKAMKQYQTSLEVSLRREGKAYPGAFHSAYVDEEGRYVIDGIGPGRWIVTSYPLSLAEVGKQRLIDVGPSEVEVTVDLMVQPR